MTFRSPQGLQVAGQGEVLTPPPGPGGHWEETAMRAGLGAWGDKGAQA